MDRIEKTKLTHERLKRYDDKKYNRKKNEKVLVLAERMRKNQLQANSTNNLFKISLFF